MKRYIIITHRSKTSKSWFNYKLFLLILYFPFIVLKCAFETLPCLCETLIWSVCNWYLHVEHNPNVCETNLCQNFHVKHKTCLTSLLKSRAVCNCYLQIYSEHQSIQNINLFRTSIYSEQQETIQTLKKHSRKFLKCV